ncbi:MAG TPA: hypothetical protein VH054_19220 [Polyangiaceae bacterium]|jgi:hypothetical protein|nr:hypothetical protein [Polyangiaceae bacterium]
MKRVAVVACSLALVASAKRAGACGVSASGAPAGICDASEVLDEKAGAAKNRVGVSYGWTSTVLFLGDLRAPTERHAAMVSFEHPMKGHWTLEVGAGSLLAGFLDTGIGRATFEPGVLADVSLSHLVLAPRGYAKPFILTSFALAGVWARTTGSVSADYVAFDFSFDVAMGIALKIGRQAISPFLAGRVYGGPVFWTYQGKDVTGSDAYHYALGPGLAFSFERSRVGLSFGGSVFGEKSAKAGVSFAF